jgi:hypothetical protein
MARRKVSRPRQAEPERREGDELRLYALLSVRVPAELALDLRRVAKERGKSVNAAVIEAVREYIGS